MRVGGVAPLRFRGVAALVCLGFVVAGCSEPDTDIRVRNPTGGVQTALPVQVMRVIDGDTLQVQMPNDNERRVRVIGIDTPEVSHPPDQNEAECFGPEAAELTTALADGQVVRLESDPVAGEEDRYGRLLAHVWLPDGSLLSRRLLAAGAAREYTYQGQDYFYRNEFRSDESDARADGQGLWGRC